MPSSQPRTQLLATDSKNSILAELVGPINRLAYTPYGQQSYRQKVVTRLGFNGELLETKLGWYILGNGYRAYNPALMRFHSPDKFSPFGKGGLNAYAYCGGEPVMRADPSGQGWVFDTFATVMNILSPVGPSGRVVRSTSSQSLIGDKTKRGFFSTLFKHLNTPKKPANPGSGSRNARKTRKTSQNENVTGSEFNSSTNPIHPGVQSSQAHHPTPRQTNDSRGQPGYVLTKNIYEQFNQNAYNTVKTRNGLKLSGADSGSAQTASHSKASTSTGIRRR